MDAADNQPQHGQASPDDRHPEDAPRHQQLQQQEKQRRQPPNRNGDHSHIQLNPRRIARDTSIQRYPASSSPAHEQPQQDYSMRSTAAVDTRYAPLIESPLILPLFL